MSKVWFVTGATRGIGLAIARGALASGESVIATGRKLDQITQGLGARNERLLPLALDITVPEQVTSAVKAGIEHFGRIDVLVNNAGYGQLGMFEESSRAEIEEQFRVNVFGTMDVTRAVLPIMRKQRSGHVFTISSIAGLRGGTAASLYCSTKFALEGWSESLAAEVAPFGIHFTAIEPGFFRTDFLDSSSVRYATASLSDYAEETRKLRDFFDARSHQQAGDPAKLAEALLQLAANPNPPAHFLAGTDAVQVLKARIELDQKQLAEWEALSSSTDYTLGQ